MAENIKRGNAEKILIAALKSECIKNDLIAGNIRDILQGNHKTYKYILVTGLLAKATNENINPLALQSGAPIAGAYDARSLCHQILVPFERDFLQNALGGSNEPFLNKPARFTHLSDKNAVRKGQDKITLLKLIDILSEIKSSAEAKEYLTCSLAYLNERINQLIELQDTSINYNPTLVDIYDFIYRFLEKSFEGETSAIIVGALDKMFYNRISPDYTVIAHKVNQSGASSKEIGDIDVYKDDSFQFAIEVKDKDFSEHDLEHAMKKMMRSGAKKGQFIYGPNATFNSDILKKKIAEYEEKGFMVLFQDIFTYSRTMIFKIDISSKQEFLDVVMSTAIELNSKEETKVWFQKLLEDLNWKVTY